MTVTKNRDNSTVSNFVESRSNGTVDGVTQIYIMIININVSRILILMYY